MNRMAYGRNVCRRRAPICALALAIAALPSGAYAQTAAAEESATTISEVVVTARKRDERLLDVPLSIQAISEAEIRSAGIDDVQSLKARAGFQFPPQVSNGPAGRFTGVLVFRGLQANSFGQQRDNSGSLFVDGIYVSGGVQSVNTVDVARIEVLKGPQNAYFGRSTFGGAVNFITRNPAEEFGGEMNLRLTEQGTVAGDVSIEGPLVAEKLSGRLTATFSDKSSQYRAADGGRLGEEQSQSITGTLMFKPTEDLWFRLRGSYQEDDDSAPAFAFISANTFASGACTGRTFSGFNGRTGAGPITLARNYFCNGLPGLSTVGSGVVTANTVLPQVFVDALRSGQVSSSLAPGAALRPARLFADAPVLDHAGMKRESVRIALQSGFTFDSGASLAFNIGYAQQDSVAVNDVDRTNVLGFENALAFLSRDLTVDGRFSTNPDKRLRLLLGASYFEGKSQFSEMSFSVFTNNTVQQGQFVDDRADVPAVYASVDYDVLEKVTVTAEARYQEDTITSYNLAGVKTEKTFSDVLPRYIVSFKPSDRLNLYASYSRGVQPAGVNTGFNGLTAPTLAFPAEARAYVQSVYPGIGPFSLLPELDAYEIGVKQSLFDGALDYTLAIYRNDWDNATTVSALFNPAACFPTGAPAISNTAACPLLGAGTSTVTPNSAQITGVELGVTGRLGDSWTVDLTLDYKDTEWKRYANSGFNAFAGLTSPGDVYRADGNELGRVPKLTGALSATYRGAAFGDDWKWYARGDALYTGAAWDSDLNIYKSDAYTRVNAAFGIERNELLLELYSTNLFDDDTWDYAAITVELSGNFSQRAAAVLPPREREFGLRARYRF